jgi:hypothetical protein
MYYLSDYNRFILSKYRTHLELIDTVPIGFAGVANERPAPVFTNETSEDALYVAAGVTFNAPGVLVRIRSISPQYEWMADDSVTPQDTPVNAIAGASTQVMPLIPLVVGFFIQKQGRLQMQLTNDAAGSITGGLWTWRAIRLTNPIDGGWNYNLGFGS